MARAKVRFGADGPRWSNVYPSGADELHLPSDGFKVVHCESLAEARAAADALGADMDGTNRRTYVRWLGVDCVWTGRGRPAQAVALASTHMAAVLPLWAVGGVVPEEWRAFLRSADLNKVTAGTGALRCALRAAGAPAFRCFDVGRLAAADGVVTGVSWSTSDIHLRIQGTVVPLHRHLRSLSWAGELSDEQAGLLALHARGALRIVEKLELPMTAQAG